MKKIFFVFIFCILSSALAFRLKNYVIVAQQQGYNQVTQQAEDDYLLQFNKYNEAHQEYIAAKNAYIKYATVASQTEAINKAKQASILRAEALRTYLQLFMNIINYQNNLDVSLKSTQTGKLEAMQSMINTHKQSMENTSNIAQVNAEAKYFEGKLDNITDLAYESLSIILIGEMQDMDVRSKQILAHFEREFASLDDEKIKRGINEVNENLVNYRQSIENTHQYVLQYRNSQTGKRPIKALTTHKNVKQEVTSSLEILESIAILFKEFEVRIKQWPN